MLEIKNVYKTFNAGTINEKKALQNLNLTLQTGDFCTVIGGNGAGKSTMLNAVSGVWPVDSGAILIDGVDISGLCEYKRAPFLGRVFQDPMNGTAADMQIIENLALAARRGEKRRILRWGVPKTDTEKYREMLKTLDLGLEDRLTTKVGLLSGGQRQALTLLMATIQKPKLLLLDEPAAGMNNDECNELVEVLKKIHNELGFTVALIEHHIDFVMNLCNRLYVLNLGKILAEGTPEAVQNDPNVIKAYLGERRNGRGK